MLYRWCYKNQSLAKSPSFQIFYVEKEKRRRKTYPDLFRKLLTISWKVSGELCFTAFCGQLQIWVMPCNLSLLGTFTEAIRGIRMLEAGSRMHRRAGETCEWLSGCAMKGQLDNSCPSPEPGPYPMSLKIKLGVCFPPSLMAQKVYWLKNQHRTMSLWLFYWLQGPRNNGYNMRLYCVWENRGNSQVSRTFCVFSASVRLLCLGSLAYF